MSSPFFPLGGDCIYLFPDELWLKILGFLSKGEICMVGATSHRMNNLSKDPALWRNLVFDWSDLKKNFPSIIAVMERATKAETLTFTKIKRKSDEDVDLMSTKITSLAEKVKDSLKKLVVDQQIILKNAAVERLGCLTKLEVLDFCAVNIRCSGRSGYLSDTGFAAITKLRNLKELKIGNFRQIIYFIHLTNDQTRRHVEMVQGLVQMFQELKNLVVVEIETLGPVYEPFQILARNNPNLEDLAFNSGCVDATLKCLAQNCPKLRKLRIFDCRNLGQNLTEEGLNTLAQCKKLVHLELSYCDELTDMSLQNIAQGCSHLTTLNLSRCRLVTDEGIKTLAANCGNLTTLKFTACHLVTDDGIKALAAKCGNLTALHISGCHLVTDDGIKTLAANCGNLTILDFGGCRLVTDEGIKALAAKCGNLTTLNLMHCSLVTHDEIRALAEIGIDVMHSHTPHNNH